jgi:hypothetical protein
LEEIASLKTIMKNSILILLSLTLSLSSCKKITNVKAIEPIDSGSFKYQLVNDAGEGVANIKVRAYRATKNERGCIQ